MRFLYNTFATQLEERFKIDSRYFLSGGFWLSVGQIATIVFGLISTALFAHFLTENEFGLYKYLIGVSVILSSFSLTGIGQSVLQMAAKGYASFYSKTLKLNFLYSLGITLAGVVGSIYYWYNENSTLAMGCLMVAILQPFIATLQNIPSLLQGSGKFKENTYLHIGRMFGTTLISITALLLTKSVIVLFFTYLSANLLVLLASNFLFKPKEQEIPSEIFTKYLSYAKHTSVRNVISNIAQRADTIIVFTQLGAAELAIYSIATLIPEQIKGSFKNLASLLLPKYSRTHNSLLIKKNIPKRSLQLAIILSIVSLLYIFASPYLYTILFPKYYDHLIYSQILTLSFPAMIALIPTSFLEANLKNKSLHTANLLIAITAVVLTYLGTAQFGLLGAITAKVIQRYVSTIIIFTLYARLQN